MLGSSLGGLISFAIAYWYPDVFGFAGGMSSTFGWGRIGADNDLLQDWYAAEDLAARQQVYYLDSGGGFVQGESCTDPDAQWRDNYCENNSLPRLLVSKGINTFPDDPDADPLTPENINIYHWHEVGAPHNESAWAARLHRPLRLFFPGALTPITFGNRIGSGLLPPFFENPIHNRNQVHGYQSCGDGRRATGDGCPSSSRIPVKPTKGSGSRCGLLRLRLRHRLRLRATGDGGRGTDDGGRATGAHRALDDV